MSTDDRQLLEAAAKAAGMTVEYWAQDDYPVVRDGAANVGWNPLVLDSDALRLAVKLKLEIIPIEGGGVDILRCAENEPFSELLATETSADHYAATRRAIVRAAAAMATEKTHEQ